MWKLSLHLQEHYEKYDGFVILHGTDTMAYTASALSFMCENLGKTIVLTGSQVMGLIWSQKPYFWFLYAKLGSLLMISVWFSRAAWASGQGEWSQCS